MAIMIRLSKMGEEQGTVRYAEEDEERNRVLAGPLLLNTSMLGDPPPAEIQLTLEWYQPPALHEPAGRGQTTSSSGSTALKRGERVKIVKSRVSGVKYPPEWLEQYLGRTGVVLWATADGAMLDLGGEASWFSYHELEPR